MALTTDEIKYIRHELENCARPLFLFDDDPDGLTSFLLLYRFKKEGKGVVVKSSPTVPVDYIRKVVEHQPDIIFILDKPMVSEEFIKGCKGTKIIWIDHHAPQKMEGVKYFNPRIHDDEDNRPTCYWAHKVVEQDLWIAMAGIVGDWSLPDDVTNEFKEKYPDLLGKDVNRPQDALFNSKIGRIPRMFSFLLKGRTSVNKLVGYFQQTRTFLNEVRAELKKVTWPPKKEVYATTMVVVMTVFFFGFYLYGLDLILSYAAAALTRLVGGS